MKALSFECNNGDLRRKQGSCLRDDLALDDFVGLLQYLLEFLGPSWVL